MTLIPDWNILGAYNYTSWSLLGSSDPPNWSILGAILKCFMVTFPIYQFSNILSQNIEKKFGGYPPFGPLKIIAREK